VVIVGSLLLILVSVGLLVGGVVDGSNPLVVGSIVATAVAIVVLVIGVRQSAAGDGDDADSDDEADDRPTGRIGPPVRDSGFRSTRQTLRERDTSRHAEGPDRGERPDRYDRPERFERDEPVRAGRAAERASVLVEEPLAIPAQNMPRVTEPYEAAGFDETDPYAAGVEEVPAASTALDDEFEDDPPDEPSIQFVTPSNASRVAMLTAEVLVIDGRPRYHMAGCVHLLGRESEPLPVGEAVELGFTPCALCEPDSALLAEARRV